MPAALTLFEDSAKDRKARGAFFTPEPISAFITEWAVRSGTDRVLEPSTGDAAFLTQVVHRLQELSGPNADPPTVHGVEIHEPSAESARERVRSQGGIPDIAHDDFFNQQPEPTFTAVVGNPPYIRYQDFSGEVRLRSREAALRAGVSLTALASSWAAFTVHSALFLAPGGRLGLVLPAELLSVNYAAAVRRFLFDRFASVDLVLFETQVFPEAEADVLLLLADGFDQGPTNHANVFHACDADDLERLTAPITWTPDDPAGKWTGLFVDEAAAAVTDRLSRGTFARLDSWGDTTLGTVTGNNNFFALSPERVAALGIPPTDLVSLSPPGSAHLRGLDLTRRDLDELGYQGKSTFLFRPNEPLGAESASYVDAGHRAGVDQAYKCRVRRPWFRVPLSPAPDLFLTCMNADTPRLSTNSAGAHHLNSVHGVYLKDDVRALGRELLPLASLNSLTLSNAEVVGRSYGGGILKLEPREADAWLMPSVATVRENAATLLQVREAVSNCLGAGDLRGAVAHVDQALLLGAGLVTCEELAALRRSYDALAERRTTRGRRGR